MVSTHHLHTLRHRFPKRAVRRRDPPEIEAEIHREVDEILAQLKGLRLGKWERAVLTTVSHHSPTDWLMPQLAAETHSEKEAVRRAIRKLERVGLVEREPDEGDRSRSILSLTPRGEIVTDATRGTKRPGRWRNLRDGLRRRISEQRRRDRSRGA